jgi:polyisoprenyl-teichoic acid--peptidoglycan teichoic acid transferase
LKKTQPHIIILGVAAFLVVISLGLYISKQFGHLKIDKSITELKRVNFLMHAISEGNEYYFSVWITLYPRDKKVGLYFVNPLSQFESEDDTLIKLKTGALKTVEKELAEILGQSPNYKITIQENNFKRIIDLAGGLPVYFEPKATVTSLKYNRPNNGNYVLDGEDAFDYLTKLDGKEALSFVYRLEKQESALLSFYSFIHNNKELIKKPWLQFFVSLIDTNMSEDEVSSLIDFLLEDEIYFGVSELPGEIQASSNKDEFSLKIRKDTAKIAFKKFEADLLSEFFADTERSRVEVLNGTSLNGLAKKGKSLLNERRIKVLSVENAWSDDFKESIVLNRSGNTKISTKVAEAIQSQNVFFSIRKELGLDATVVLGENFGKTKN